MKTTQTELSLWMRRVGIIAVVVVLTSMVACEREAPDVQTPKPKVETSKPVPTKPPVEAAPETSKSADLQKLVGRWIRTDTPYVIEIRTVKDDGTLEAAYYNPNPINIARAGAKEKDHGLEVFVEFDDVNYRGSTYTLLYDKARDILYGNYFQATMRQNYNVAFIRQPQGR